MQNSMMLFTFSVLDWKYPFYDKFGVKKLKLSVWGETCNPDLFDYAEFNGGVHFFTFSTGNTIFG